MDDTNLGGNVVLNTFCSVLYKKMIQSVQVTAQYWKKYSTYWQRNLKRRKNLHMVMLKLWANFHLHILKSD